ncbi:radical SAM protein [Helicobacter sp. 11S02596-1]|uniref:radical SAM/SPASM domain-containing protein n=1 Tax=Helicobacter sp. 11S02596-1 TaxID=1476194 RepID=UPI000BA52481|nr:radical SAM protein [Helicobacter sp. 11S02596-1]PAF45165.1 hypothetical protein BJI48_00950 [Helicobacter sp. 11S02596-1]
MKISRPYELLSRDKNIPLNKTAGRFYFEKFIHTFHKDDKYFSALFGYNNPSPEDKQHIFKKFVCIINLETNAYCNRTCGYCPLSFFDRKSKNPKHFKEISITDGLFSKIIDELAQIHYASTISLNLYNEPLSDIHLFKRIAEIKSKLPDVFLRFNSNGDLLDKPTLERLADSGLDSINITLHTLKNEVYNDKKSQTKIERFYHRLALPLPELQINENKNITSSLQIGNLLMLVNTSNWGAFGNDRGGGIKELSIQGRTQPCPKVFREMNIDYLGNVFLCCNIFPDDPKNKPLGNLNEHSLFEIFASKKLAKFRQHLFDFSEKMSPCATCNEESFDDGRSNHDNVLEKIKQGASFE